MSDKVQVSGGGIGFFGLLGILFIGLKLGGVITWPWLWVLCPLWGPLVLVLTTVFMIFSVALAIIGLKVLTSRK
jgi:hypothetical protein